MPSGRIPNDVDRTPVRRRIEWGPRGARWSVIALMLAACGSGGPGDGGIGAVDGGGIDAGALHDGAVALDGHVSDASDADDPEMDGGDATCPLPGAPGTIHLHDFTGVDGNVFIETIEPAGEGMWATARSFVWVHEEGATVARSAPDGVILMRLDEQGALADARRLPIAAASETAAASVRGGVVLTFTLDQSLWVMSIGDDWAIRWTRRITGPSSSGVIYGAPHVAADARAIYVTAPVVNGTPVERASPTGLHVARFEHDGAVLWERRVHVASRYVDDRLRRASLIATSLTAGAGGVLLTTKTTSFGERFFHFLGLDEAVRSPWVLFFDEAGEMVWQRFIDPGVGWFSSFDAVTRNVDGWFLAGEIRGGEMLGARPLIARIDDRGALQYAAVVDGLFGGSVKNLFARGGELMAVITTPTKTFVAEVFPDFSYREVIRLGGDTANLHADEASVWYVGNPPSCSGFEWPGCGEATVPVPRFAMVRMPLDGDRGCSDALRTSPWWTPTVMGLAAVEYDPGVLARWWHESEITDLPAMAMEPVTFTHQRLCLADISGDDTDPRRARCLALESDAEP